MQPITYYVQTPAIDALVNEYGDRLEVMTRQDRLSFLQILVNRLIDPVDVEPDATDKVIQAWWLIVREPESTLTSLIAAIAMQLDSTKP